MRAYFCNLVFEKNSVSHIRKWHRISQYVCDYTAEAARWTMPITITILDSRLIAPRWT